MKPILLFDLDGTLINSIPGIQKALNLMLSEHNLRRVTADEVASFVGNGPKVLVERTFKAVDPTGKWDSEKEKRLFYSHYVSTSLTGSVLYDNVLETLQFLKDKNYPMAICTNKPQRATLRILFFLGLTDFFETVIGGDLLPFSKPHPEHLHYALRLINLKDRSAIMIGDSITDKKAAKAAKLPFVAVSYGYGQPKDLEDSDFLIHSIEELKTILAALDE